MSSDLIGERVCDVDVESDSIAVFIDVLERRVSRVRADLHRARLQNRSESRALTWAWVSTCCVRVAVIREDNRSLEPCTEDQVVFARVNNRRDGDVECIEQLVRILAYSESEGLV